MSLPPRSRRKRGRENLPEHGDKSPLLQPRPGQILGSKQNSSDRRCATTTAWGRSPGPLVSGGRLHDDDVVRRYEVEGRPDAFVEQIWIDMLRPKVRDSEVQRRTLRPNRVEIGGRRADLAVQAQPRLKPALALDQMVRKIPGQGDPNDRAEDEMDAPPECAQYGHAAEGPREDRAVN